MRVRRRKDCHHSHGQTGKARIEELRSQIGDVAEELKAMNDEYTALVKKQLKCKACLGTGENSRRGVCAPCNGTGRR